MERFLFIKKRKCAHLVNIKWMTQEIFLFQHPNEALQMNYIILAEYQILINLPKSVAISWFFFICALFVSLQRKSLWLEQKEVLWKNNTTAIPVSTLAKITCNFHSKTEWKNKICYIEKYKINANEIKVKLSCVKYTNAPCYSIENPTLNILSSVYA